MKTRISTCASILILITLISQSAEGARFLVIKEPLIEVIRDGHKLNQRATSFLRPKDELRLSANAVGYLFTTAGQAKLIGPNVLKIEEDPNLRGEANRAAPMDLEAPIETIFHAPNANSLLHLRPAILRDAGKALATALRAMANPGNERTLTPSGATSNTDPILRWREGEKKADFISITAIDPPSDGKPIRFRRRSYRFHCMNAKPGQRLTAYQNTPNLLKRGHYYLFKVWQSDEDAALAGDWVIFRVAPEDEALPQPESDAEALASIFGLLDEANEANFRPGEALDRLLSLQEPFASSELALRYQYFIFLHEGLHAEAEHVMNRLQELYPE